jgi:hypothetical protein
MITYIRQQVLLSLNQVNENEPLLRKPEPPELPELMQIGPHLPHDMIDLEPLYNDQDPKLRRRRCEKWELFQPPTQSKASSLEPPLKPLPPIEPPPPP